MQSITAFFGPRQKRRRTTTELASEADEPDSDHDSTPSRVVTNYAEGGSPPHALEIDQSGLDTAAALPHVGLLDIAQYCTTCTGSNVDDDTKLKLIQSRVPGPSIAMPSRQYADSTRVSGFRSRFCNREWFARFPFATFSVSLGGIFCLPCVLFPVEQHSSGRAQVLVSRPLVNWKDAVADLKAHSQLQYHIASESKMEAFLQVCADPSKRIDVSLSKRIGERVEKNRKIITSIIKCVELCGRQGIALRGHRDDSTSSTLSQGNFKAVADFRAQAGDVALQEHLKTCSSRETYMSKTAQNELLLCMGDFIRNAIVDDIHESKFFSIIADEVCDVSNWEQLGIVIRYLKDGQPVEKLLGYVACESVCGEDIFREITVFLARCNIDVQMCRGQGYDGAGAMAGALNGCQAKLQSVVPQAIYYHCSSHQLNLALSKACSVPEIQQMVSTLKSVGIFFKYSPKRQRRLEACVEQVNEKKRKEMEAEIPKKKLKLLCDTRWVERHTAMEDFHLLFEPLVLCLSQISLHDGSIKWDAKSTTEANGLLKAIQSSQFLVAFYTCRYFFGFTKNIAKLLQGTSKDVLAAYKDLSTTKACIAAARADGEERFKNIFELANNASELSGGERIVVPRVCAAQRHRCNHPASSPEEFWRRSVYIPFADHLVAEFSSRFNQLSTTAVSGMCLLPVNAVNGISESKAKDLKSMFSCDLPDSDSFFQEVERWVTRWKVVESLPQSLVDAYNATNCSLYPNISHILHLLLVAPVTSASAERANSALGFIKTDLRSTMSQERLNDLILLFVHKDIPLDYPKIVDRFAVRAPRRMKLVDPMHGEDDES